MIRGFTLPQLVGAGDVGAVAGTVTSGQPIAGELLAVHVVYTGGTSTEDLTISTVDGGQTILSLANNQASGWYYPRLQTHSYGGTALEFASGYAQTAPLPIAGDYVQAVMAEGGTAGNTVDVTLVYRD